MAAKQDTLTFTRVFYDSAELRKSYREVFPKLIDAGSLKTNFDVTFPTPDAKYNATAVQKKGDAVLASIERRFKRQFEKFFPLIEADYGKDQQGDSKAYANAKKNLDKLNKYIEDLTSGMRADVRIGIASLLKIESKTLSTIGSDNYSKFTLRRGVFTGDDPLNADNDETYSDLAVALKQGQGKWHYCGIAANGTMAYVVVDKKKPVKKSSLQDLRKDVGGSAVVLKGICYPKGTSVKFRMLVESKKNPKMVHIRDGLKVQLGKAVKVLPVKYDLQSMPTSAELTKLDANGNLKGEAKK